MIERNTTIPTRRSEVFTTASDNQPEVPVHVLQGESEMADRNASLGRFDLTGIAPAPRGVPKIEVTFDIDANGIVNVSAMDQGTGKSQQITITGGTALPKDKIEEMVKEAEAHAAEDHARREAAEARNQADLASYQIEKQLEEHGSALSDEERSNIADKVAAVKKLLEDPAADATDLNSSTEEMLQAAQVLGQKIYEQAQASGEPDEGAQSDEEVVEAEIVDEGEDS
jgi:molecular chaperone DnaK